MLHVHLTETIEVLTDYLEQLNLNSEQITLVKKIYNFTVDLKNLPEVNNVEMTDWSHSIRNCDDTVQTSDNCDVSYYKNDEHFVHILRTLMYLRISQTQCIFMNSMNTVSTVLKTTKKTKNSINTVSTVLNMTKKTKRTRISWK